MNALINKFSAFAVLACTAMLFFSSCEKDEEKATGNLSGTETLDGQVLFKKGFSTKAAYVDMETNFVDGDEIGVYAVARANNKPGPLLEKGNYADNVRYKYVAESNMFVPVNNKETIFNNPVGVLDFYVYYPYSSNIIDATQIPHYISGDQTSDTNFTKADMMAATCVGYKDGVAALQFKKMMACLEVIVNKRTENGVKEVTLKNRDNGSVVNIASDDVVTIDNKRDIRMKLFKETPSEYHFRAHMPAQTIAENDFFAIVTLSNGKTKQYNNSSALSLKKGILTQYDITLQSRIKVIAGPGGTVSVTAPTDPDHVYKDGTAVVAEAQAEPGWHFSHWQENGSSVGTDNPMTFVSETNRTITAIFERGYFLIGTGISYPNGQHPRLGGNGCTVTPGRSYVYETKAQLTATVGNGFHFGGWTDGNSSTQRWETAGPADMTYTAQFLRNNYRVSGSASPSDGGSVSGGGNVLFGDPASLSASSAGGFHFVGWSDGTSSNTLNISEVNGDMSYTAYFEADPVTPPEPDPAPDPDPNPGPDPTPDPDNPGGGDGGDTPPPAPTYCINCAITGQGTVSGTGCGKTNGTYTLTATPAAGWSSDWTTKQVTINGADVNASVTFTKKVETVTISVGTQKGGSYGPSIIMRASGGGEKVVGSSCTISTTAKSKTENGTTYIPTFDGWFLNGRLVSESESYTFTVTTSQSYTAQWSWYR